MKAVTKYRAGVSLLSVAAVVAVAIPSVVNLVSRAEEREAHAQAYTSYVAEATIEHELKIDAHRTVRLAHYSEAYDAHAAAVADAQAAVASALGKVDTTTSQTAIADASLIGTPAEMAERTRALAVAASDIRSAVSAYDAEQARLAAEAAAAAERAAAEQQAAEESYSGGSDDSYDAPGSSGGGGGGVDHIEYVAGYGGQSLIDACVGSVMWDFSYYGGGYGLAEHWSCGGSSFPQWAGAIVEIPGYGTYRVDGVLGGFNNSDPSTYWAPSQFFYQTCQGGNPNNSIFIGLTQI